MAPLGAAVLASRGMESCRPLAGSPIGRPERHWKPRSRVCRYESVRSCSSRQIYLPVPSAAICATFIIASRPESFALE
jgi:hypothetical protein